MPLTRDQTLQQLHAWTANHSLLGYGRAVEIVTHNISANDLIWEFFQKHKLK